MPDWVAVAHLPPYKVQRILYRWSVEAPRAIMPNRQRTIYSFHTAAGARVPSAPAPLPAQAAAPSATAPNAGHAIEPEQNGADATTQHAGASAPSRSTATATLARDRRHNIDDVPAPWGVTPQQDALRGAIMCHDSDGRCPYSASHKCHSAATTGYVALLSITPTSLCSGKTPTVEQYTAARERMSLVDLIRCERCAVGIHPACAIDCSEWSGKVGEPGGCTIARSGLVRLVGPGAVRYKRHPQGLTSLLQAASASSTSFSPMLLITTRVALRTAASTRRVRGDCRGG